MAPPLTALPTDPVKPLGTMVRAKCAGWQHVADDDYLLSHEEGLDILPTLEGAPEWVEGALDGFNVTGSTRPYFKHQVDGWDVDPETIEEI